MAIDKDARLALLTGRDAIELGGQEVELGLCLGESKSRRESPKNDEVTLGWIGLKSREHGDRRPNIDLVKQFDTTKAAWGDPNHGEARAIDGDGLANHAGVGVQSGCPKCMADDHDGVFTRLALLVGPETTAG